MPDEGSGSGRKLRLALRDLGQPPEREQLRGRALAENPRGGVLAQRGAELEAVAGAAAQNPKVSGFRMGARDQVAVRTVFILADLGAQERRAGDLGEAPGERLA